MIEAIILAGGQGLRLRPVIGNVPKPMADIAGRPFLWWLMRNLTEQGITRMILAVGDRGRVIQKYFGNSFEGTEIAYTVERVPLGTGGAIKLALGKAESRRLMVLNGDSYARISVKHLLSEFDSSQMPLAVAVSFVKQSGRYGTTLIDEKTNRITGFVEKQIEGPGYVNAGIYFIRREIFSGWDQAERFSFERDFLPKYLERMKPLALKGVQEFVDIGVPETYALAQTRIPALAGAHREQWQQTAKKG